MQEMDVRRAVLRDYEAFILHDTIALYTLEELQTAMQFKRLSERLHSMRLLSTNCHIIPQSPCAHSWACTEKPSLVVIEQRCCNGKPSACKWRLHLIKKCVCTDIMDSSTKKGKQGSIKIAYFLHPAEPYQFEIAMG